jgi:DNA-binding response OmpR family regulator
MKAKRILVTDDDPSILCLVATILRRANFEVDTAASGKEAIAKTKLIAYDVIVLDLMMPAMSGVEVLAHFNNAHPLKTKFVVIMSAAPHDVITNAITTNVFAALHKPAGIHEIVETVRACIAAA